MERNPRISLSLVRSDGKADRSIEVGDETATMYVEYPDHKVTVMPDGRGFHVHIQPKGWDDMEVIGIRYDEGHVHVWVNQHNLAHLKVSHPFEDYVEIRPERIKEEKK